MPELQEFIADDVHGCSLVPSVLRSASKMYVLRAPRQSCISSSSRRIAAGPAAYGSLLCQADVRSALCRSCKGTVQTNYVDFSLCPACSCRERRCMICGTAPHGRRGASSSPSGALMPSRMTGLPEDALPLPPPPPQPGWSPIGARKSSSMRDVGEGSESPLARRRGRAGQVAPKTASWRTSSRPYRGSAEWEAPSSAPDQEPRVPAQRPPSPGLRRRGGSVPATAPEPHLTIA